MRHVVGVKERARCGTRPSRVGICETSTWAPETRQSRRMSLVEAIANVAVGYGVALLTQIMVFPLFDIEVTLGKNLEIGSLFTVASLCRAYVLRRVFEAIRVRGARTITAGHGTRRHRPW